MLVYCVGGAVRDELLGLAVKDKDFVVVGTTPQAMLNAGYKLPVAEAIEIIHQNGKDGITASELVHLMRVDRLTANRIITILMDKGFLKSSSRRNDAEEVFDAVK